MTQHESLIFKKYLLAKQYRKYRKKTLVDIKIALVELSVRKRLLHFFISISNVKDTRYYILFKTV